MGLFAIVFPLSAYVSNMRLLKQLSMKAVSSEVPLHSERASLIQLNSISWLPKKNQAQKAKRKPTYFPDQSKLCSIAMAPDISFFFSLTRQEFSWRPASFFFFFFFFGLTLFSRWEKWSLKYQFRLIGSSTIEKASEALLSLI